MGSLPVPGPWQVPATPGSRGDHVPLPPGTLPYRMPMGGQIGEALTSFLNNYHQAQDAKKIRNQNDFWNSLRLIQMGLGQNIDLKKVYKMAEQGGIPLEKGMSPMEAQAHLQQQQAQDVAAAPTPGMPGLQQFAQQQAQAPPPLAQQPGFLQRLAQMVHPPPKQYDTTGLEQYRQAVGQAGTGIAAQTQRQGFMQRLQDMAAKEGFDLNSAHTAVQQKLLGVMGKALQDPTHPAWDILERGGLAKQLGPMGDLLDLAPSLLPQMPADQAHQLVGGTILAREMGLPQMRLQMMMQAKDLAPQFGNNMAMAQQYLNDIYTKGISTLRPGWSPEQLEKLGSAQKVIFDAYPKAPASMVMGAVHAQVLGEDARPWLNALAATDPARSGSISDLRKGQELNIQQQQANTAEFNSRTDLGRLNQQISFERGQLDISKYKAIKEATESQAGQAWKIYEDEKQPWAVRQGAMRVIADTWNKGSRAQLEWNGGKYSVDDPVQVLQGGNWATAQSAMTPFSGTPLSAIWQGGTPALSPKTAPPGMLGNTPPLQSGQPVTNGTPPQDYGDFVRKGIGANFMGMNPQDVQTFIKHLDTNVFKHGETDPDTINRLLQFNGQPTLPPAPAVQSTPQGPPQAQQPADQQQPQEE